MSQLSTRVNDLSTAVATQIKTVKTLLNGNLADLSGLNTTAKTNFVAAVNELNTRINALSNATSIDDAHSTTTSTYSSSHIDSTIASKTEINDGSNTTTNTLSASKINSNISTAVANKTEINDASTTTSNTWSASKTLSQITQAASNAVSAVTNGAPAVLDTLKELADALGDDPNFSTTIVAGLNNRLRFDAAQSLTSAQQAQAKANLDAFGNAEIGNPDTNFVATFTAGLQ